MVVPESLKLNKFKMVKIPSNKSYFQRFGYGLTPEKAFSGDDFMPSGNKTDILQQMQHQYEKESE